LWLLQDLLAIVVLVHAMGLNGGNKTIKEMRECGCALFFIMMLDGKGAEEKDDG